MPGLPLFVGFLVAAISHQVVLIQPKVGFKPAALLIFINAKVYPVKNADLKIPHAVCLDSEPGLKSSRFLINLTKTIPVRGNIIMFSLMSKNIHKAK